MAEITDKFGKASIDTDYAIATTVKTARTPGATVLEAYDVSKFSDDTPVFFVTYKKVTDPVTSEVTVVDLVSYKALVNAGANTLTNIETAPGYTDLGNDEDDFIECIPTSHWENSLVEGILTSLNPSGTLKSTAITETGWDGWLNAKESWSYDGWTSATRMGTITVPTDATTKYVNGMRIKITQSTGGTKRGIIHKVEATKLTVFFPVGTTLNNETITNPFYSNVSSPAGFDRDKVLWTVELVSSTLRSTASATFVSLTDAITIGAGAWKLSLKVYLYVGTGISQTEQGVRVSLSDSGTTETHPNLSLSERYTFASTATKNYANSAYSEDDIKLTAPSTFTLIGKSDGGGGGATIQVQASTLPTIIRAVSNYLQRDL